MGELSKSDMNQSQTREEFAANEGVTLCQDVGARLDVTMHVTKN